MRKSLLEVLFLLAVTLAAAGLTWKIAGAPEQGPVCEPTELAEGQICYADAAKLENVVWVDARTRELWESNGLPNSVLLTDHPSEDWPSLLAESFESLSLADFVIVYCATEGCGSSKPVAEKIQNLGLFDSNQVLVLYGGWKSLPVESP